MRVPAFALFAIASAFVALNASAETPALYPYADAQVRRILAHGPWPPSRAVDPSNRVSGNAAAIAVGDALLRTT